nr:5450_t:CDS:2 [Entrophospora candida]
MTLGQLTAQLGNQQGGNGNAAVPTAPPRISVLISIFKGELRENVSAWLMQVETIFAAQGINDAAATCCYYAAPE